MNKDFTEGEMCCIKHLWRMCTFPQCKYKHKDFLHKDAKMRKHGHFLNLVQRWGQPTGTPPDGWTPKAAPAMPVDA